MTTDLQDFALRLGQTIAWCSRSSAEADSTRLRTPALAQLSLLKAKDASARIRSVQENQFSIWIPSYGRKSSTFLVTTVRS